MRRDRAGAGEWCGLARARDPHGLGMHDRARRRARLDGGNLGPRASLIVRWALPALGREPDRHVGYDTRAMGFFRKLFGGGDDDEPAAPSVPAGPPADDPEPTPSSAASATHSATTDDPYRGPAYVATELEHEEIVQVGAADPIFNRRGRVLALEANRRGPLPLRSMVYTGLSRDRPVLRRVTFGEKGYRIDWEHRTPFERAISGYLVRVEDRVLLPLRAGVMAVHVETGKPCWELPHPAPLAKEPRMDREGNLLFVFEDQTWMVIAPRDGATIREGVARNERDASQIAEGCTEIGGRNRSSVRYSGVTVELGRASLLVVGRSHQNDGEPMAPTEGNYPIDSEWEPTDWLVLAGQKLHLGLNRHWGNKLWAAVGILDPTSLVALQLLELGQVTIRAHHSLEDELWRMQCWAVDDLLVVDTVISDDPGHTFFIIDPTSERVVAMLREDGADAFLFDRFGARIWAKPL